VWNDLLRFIDPFIVLSSLSAILQKESLSDGGHPFILTTEIFNHFEINVFV